MKPLLLLFALLASLSCGARSMTEIWNAMPDSLLPYVDKNHRLEMTEFIHMGLSGDVDNQLGGKSDMDTLTASYLHVVLTESSELHLRRLPSAQGDSILCMVRTWSGPAQESEIYFFTQDWQPLALATPLDSAHIAATRQALLVRPDTMAVSTFDSLAALLSPRMVGARLFADSDDLELQLGTPFSFTEQKAGLAAITPKKRYHWNGKTFAQ